MATTWQTAKVFISSTFRDMHAERDHLVKVVFPALREELEKHRVHLVDIDLANKGDVLNCRGKMPSLRRNSLPESFNLPGELRMSPLPTTVEFVRRFALHIIPKGLVRIRQYGLLAHRDRGERLALCRSLLAAGAGPSPETESPSPSASGGSTDNNQSPSGVGPAPSLVEPKSAALSRMGISILVVLVSLLVALGDTAWFSSSRAVPPAAATPEDRCLGCGVGHLQTIWRAGRPGRIERQRIAILDSS